MSLTSYRAAPSRDNGLEEALALPRQLTLRSKDNERDAI